MKKFLFALFPLMHGLSGQQSVQISPQCVLSFTLTGNGSSSAFDNRFTGCNNWSVAWETFAASPASSLTFQQAPSNSAGTAAGTFATFSGTPLTGANPSTATLGSMTIQGYSPWVRVNVSGLTGTARGMILGCRLPCSLSSGSGGGGGSVTVTNFPAVQNVLQTAVCPSRAVISVSASGLTQILAAVGGQTITVCHISMSYASSVDWSLSQGTGTNCGTGTGSLTGTYSSITGVALDRDMAPLVLTVGNALCVNNGSAVVGGGLLIYKQN